MRLTRVFLLAIAATAAMPAIAQSAAPVPQSAQPARFSVDVVGRGPDVILIPGLSSTRDVWADTASWLKAGHRIHLVQLRGFGEAAGPNATGPVLQPFVDELAAYIRSSGLNRPAIVGHSMGGLAAMMIAADHPSLLGRVMVVDALPFIGPIFGANDVATLRPQADAMRTMLLGQASKVAPDFAKRADCPASLPPPAKINGSMTNSGAGACLVAHGASASDLRVVAQAMHDDMVTDIRPRLAGIKVPLTLLYPQDDRLLAEAAAAKLYANAYAGLSTAKIVRIPGSYHFIMQDQPGPFRRELERFLAN